MGLRLSSIIVLILARLLMACGWAVNSIYTIAAIRVIIVIDCKGISEFFAIAPFSETLLRLALNVIVLAIIFNHFDFILYYVIGRGLLIRDIVRLEEVICTALAIGPDLEDSSSLLIRFATFFDYLWTG